MDAGAVGDNAAMMFTQGAGDVSRGLEAQGFKQDVDKSLAAQDMTQGAIEDTAEAIRNGDIETTYDDAEAAATEFRNKANDFVGEEISNISDPNPSAEQEIQARQTALKKAGMSVGMGADQ
jgi:hypothetical protein